MKPSEHGLAPQWWWKPAAEPAEEFLRESESCAKLSIKRLTTKVSSTQILFCPPKIRTGGELPPLLRDKRCAGPPACRAARGCCERETQSRGRSAPMHTAFCGAARHCIRSPQGLQYKNAELFAVCSPFSGNSSPLFRHGCPVSNTRLLARTKSARNGSTKRRFRSIASPIHPTNRPSTFLLLAARNTAWGQRAFSFRKKFHLFWGESFCE